MKDDATVQVVPVAATGPLANVKITGVAAAPARSKLRRLTVAGLECCFSLASIEVPESGFSCSMLTLQAAILLRYAIEKFSCAKTIREKSPSGSCLTSSQGCKKQLFVPSTFRNKTAPKNGAI
jgi:hypothetical protein